MSLEGIVGKLVDSRGMIFALKNIRVNKYIEIGLESQKIRLAAIDSKNHSAYVSVDFPLADYYSPPLAINLDHATLLKTLERLNSEVIIFEIDKVGSCLKLSAPEGTKNFTIGCSINNISREIVRMDPVRGQEPDIICKMDGKTFTQLLKDLQAVDVRAEMQFTKFEKGSTVSIRSLSAQMSQYSDSLQTINETIELEMAEGYMSKVILFQGQIKNLLKIMDSGRLVLKLYQEYLFITPEADELMAKRIILPLAAH